MTLSAVMRSDLVYKADLCNLYDFTFQQSSKHSPYYILILRDGGGKSVNDKIQSGKVIRHMGAELCPIGALDLLFLACFEVTKEHETFDFLNNK